jgi:hypothetical protein
MSIFTAVGSASWGSQNSAAGAAAWSNVAPNIVAVIPAGQGSAWIIWALMDSGITTGETFNGVKVQINHDFTFVGGSTRIATIFSDVLKSFTFTGAAGVSSATILANAAAASPTFTLTKAGITSSDLKAGNLFVGIYVATGAQDGSTSGAYRLSNVKFTCYFGSDTPAGGDSGSGSTKANLSNPSSNNNPGQFNGTTFAAPSCTLVAPVPTLSYVVNWGVSAPLKFPNGTQAFSELKGQNNGNSYVSSPGIITIPPGTPAGNYSVSSSISISSNWVQSSALIVLPTLTGMFSEF